MKQLSERQQKTLEEIKEKVRRGMATTDWEKKFLKDHNIEIKTENVQTNQIPLPGTAAGLFKSCSTCLGTGGVSFGRLEDDFQNIRGTILNIKGTTWSFGCPECRPLDLRTIETKLLDNPRWEFRNTDDDRKRLEKYLFNNDTM